ncbi:Ionotropic receptor 204 [Hyalella azteca]|uniref:Ionotropic receptor 204 n=1 Tax=Hyalella azteca TaxID=294128 RepID=A0A6A0HF43_HYAAZ|nr:Ionotropic receptor 204 [Hyalella azteca]
MIWYLFCATQKYPESARARFQHAVLTPRGNYSLRTVLYWPRDALTSPIRVSDGPLMPSLTELQGVPLKIAIAQVLTKYELILNRIHYIIKFMKHCLMNFLLTNDRHCSLMSPKILLARQGQREVGLGTSSPKQDRLGGYLGSLIHLIADSANFTPRVVQDKSVGKRLDNGSFTGVIGRLQRRRLAETTARDGFLDVFATPDDAVHNEGARVQTRSLHLDERLQDRGLSSFSVLQRRLPAMDFSTFLQRQTTRFITKVPAYKRDPFILINVFNIEVWLTMIFITGSGFVILAIFLGPCGESELSTEAETTDGIEYKNINRGKNVMDLPLIEADGSNILYANEKIIAENEPDFHVDCQKDYGFPDFLNFQAGKNIHDSEDKIYHRLSDANRQKEKENKSNHHSKKTKILVNFRKVTQYFNWEKALMFIKVATSQTSGIEIPAVISQTSEAGSFTHGFSAFEGDDSIVGSGDTVRKQCLLKSSRENFMFEFSSLGLTKNSLLSDIINNRIQQLRESGVVAREFNRRFRPTCDAPSLSQAASTALPLEKTEGIFLIWLARVLSACIVFAAEVWISKRASNKLEVKKALVEQGEKIDSDELNEQPSQDEQGDLQASDKSE